MKKSPTSASISTKLYRFILLAYPPAFRDQFGDQMASTFQDLAAERQAVAGRPGTVSLWATTLLETVKTIIPEYISDLKEDTMQHKSNAIIGAVLVTPAVLLFASAAALQLVGSSLYSLASSTWLYHSQIIPTIFIFLPAVAFGLNIMPALSDAIRQKASPFTYRFAKTHLFSLTIAAIGLGLIAFLLGHDTVGCMVKNPLTGHYLSSVQHCWQTH